MANFLKSLFVKGVEIDPAGATSDQVLKYNGTKFVPGTASTVGSIDDLSDVIVTTPSNGQALVYNGTNWVNGASGVAGSTYTATIGDGTNDVFVLSHGLNTRDVFVTIRNAASPYEVIDAYWAATTTGTVTIDFSVVPTTNSVRVAIYAAVTGNNTALTLDNLTDVVVSSPTNNQVLKYNASSGLWANASASGVSVLDDLTDVSVSSPVVSQPLIWDGTNWQSGPFNQYLRLGENGVTDWLDLNPQSLQLHPSAGLARFSYNEVVINDTIYQAELLPQEIIWTDWDNGNQTKIQPIGATNGQVLAFNTGSSSYVPSDISIDSLSDVVITSPTDGQVLKYNTATSLWTNASAGGGASITVSDTPPVSPAAGALWFESDSGLTFIYYDSSWVEIGAGASYDPITGIVQAKGDLILGTASQTVDRLTVGTNNQRLIANSSAATGVSWASDSTNTVIDTKGDLLVGATNDVVAKLPVGTDNQMLVANSSATNGLAWVDQPSGFRNKIINGAMTISQRGTSAISNVGGTDVYGTDRWCIYGQTSSKMTITQSTVAPPGFSNSTVITSSAATTPASGDFYGLRQHIEGYNTTDLAWGTASAKPIVVSFWVRSSIAGSYSFTVLNPAASRCFISSYTISTINTWEKKIVYINGETTGSWATGNTTGVSIWFDMGSGSSQNGTAGTWNTSATFRTSGSTNLIGTNGATFYITGVQLEANTVATPFEQRPIGTELALCQRYFFRHQPSAGELTYLSFIYAGTQYRLTLPHPSEMRAKPSSVVVTNWAGGTTPSATSTSKAATNFYSAAGNYYVDDSTIIDVSAEL